MPLAAPDQLPVHGALGRPPDHRPVHIRSELLAGDAAHRLYVGADRSRDFFVPPQPIRDPLWRHNLFETGGAPHTPARQSLRQGVLPSCERNRPLQCVNRC
jgi:hypothetical protein